MQEPRLNAFRASHVIIRHYGSRSVHSLYPLLYKVKLEIGREHVMRLTVHGTCSLAGKRSGGRGIWNRKALEERGPSHARCRAKA
jgi:hypothetical protein